jgi:hypothetical protein
MEECYRADHCDDGMRGRAVGGGHPAKCSIPVSVLSILGAVPYAGMGVGFLKMQVATSPVRHAQHVFFPSTHCSTGASALLGSVLCSALISVLEA